MSKGGQVSEIENPNEVVVVSRRDWLRVTAVAAAAGLLPGQTLADCAKPCPNPIQYSKDDQGADCIVDKNFCFLADAGSQFEVAWGFVAAFLALVIRTDLGFDDILLPDPSDATHSSALDAVIQEMKLDQTSSAGGWKKVQGYVRDPSNPDFSGRPANLREYQAMRSSAQALWERMAGLFNPGYPSRPDIKAWQLRAITLLPQSSTFKPGQPG
jgi:hypothetical protein